MSDDKYRVLIVDDAIVIRGMLSRYLEAASEFQIVGSVGDGEKALRFMRNHPEGVDLVVLDIDMPVMDGMTALPKIFELDSQVQVLMSSTLTLRNADISMEALKLGAADYVTKPSSSSELMSATDFQREFLDKARTLAAITRRKRARKAGKSADEAHKESVAPAKKFSDSSGSRTALYTSKDIKMRTGTGPLLKPHAICIGSSTGGPQALLEVTKSMGKVEQPVFITQHMPPNFTAILAEHIGKASGIETMEAKDGMTAEGGKIYVAPGNYHMTLKQEGTSIIIKLNQEPPENFCRPAVDPMLRSAAEVFGKRLFVTILTGMGADGKKGSEKVVEAGGHVIAQDEATSVVWGMPGAVAVSSLCSGIYPLSEIGAKIRSVSMGAGL